MESHRRRRRRGLPLRGFASVGGAHFRTRSRASVCPLCRPLAAGRVPSRSWRSWRFSRARLLPRATLHPSARPRTRCRTPSQRARDARGYRGASSTPRERAPWSARSCSARAWLLPSAPAAGPSVSPCPSRATTSSAGPTRSSSPRPSASIPTAPRVGSRDPSSASRTTPHACSSHGTSDLSVKNLARTTTRARHTPTTFFTFSLPILFERAGTLTRSAAARTTKPPSFSTWSTRRLARRRCTARGCSSIATVR